MKVIIATLALAAGHASADEPQRWYGWQNIVPDAVGLTAMTAGGIALAESNSGIGAGFFYGGFVVANFGGPFVHIGHGHEMRFVLSYATRSFAPVIGLLVGYAAGPTDICDRGDAVSPCTKRMIYGTIAGAFVAAAIDDAFIAWEPKQPTWGVTVAPLERGGMLLLGGSL